jgi:chemotaxis protein CheX
MIDDLDHLVSSAVASVFGTMLNLPVYEQPSGAAIVNGEPHVAGSVGFVGALTGMVFIHSSVTFARQVARKMLRAEHEVSSEELVNDAYGEMTNMVVGHIKSRLTDRGMKCALTIPSILRGSHFSLEPTSSTRRRVSTFHCDGHQVVIEVLLKPSELAVAA